MDALPRPRLGDRTYLEPTTIWGMCLSHIYIVHRNRYIASVFAVLLDILPGYFSQ